jgi:hypothetical protein
MKLSIGVLPLNSTADIILHPVKYKESIAYEPLAEEAVIALLAKELTYDLVDNKTKEFFDEMDDGYLYSESNFDEFDLETIKNSLEEKNELIIGKDILLHPRKENILKLANLLKLAGFDVNEYIEDNNFEEVDELDTFDGAVVYIADGANNDILVSNQFKIANKIKTDKILVDGKEKNVILDENLKGVFGIIFETTDNYPFKRVKIN